MQTRTRVVGLKGLVRDLRRADRALPKRLNEFTRPVAAMAAVEARNRAQAMGGVHRHVASGITSGATGGLPWAGLNPNTQPAIFGAEFGGGARPRTRQFPPWRGAGPGAGYMLIPTLVENHDEISEQIEAATFAFLETLS